MEPEVLFLKYAFPCAFIIKQRGEISDFEHQILEDAAINNKVLERKFLEKIFFRAFERIEKLTKELNKDKWDYEVIKEYFTDRHNSIIDEGMYSYAEAPESLKNLCKVHKAEIIQIKDDSLIVKYNKEKLRPVIKSLVKNVKIGDFVTIHYGYAVEKL